MSTNPPEIPPGLPLDVIAQSAAAAQDKISKVTLKDRINALEDRLATLEPLLEQLQSNAKLGPALADYISDLRKEQGFFNHARWAVGALAFFAVVLLVILLAMGLFEDKSPLLHAPPAAIATFVLGLVSGIVFLLNSFIKGVFRSTAERHADGFLPPALEKAAEFIEKVSGK